MIHQFLIQSEEDEDFSLRLALNSTSTFRDLRRLIDACLNYDHDFFTCFYLCDDAWERRYEISDGDAPSSLDPQCQYDFDTPLDQLLDDSGQRLQYIFDPLSDRALFIRLESIRSGSLREPKIIDMEGNIPHQMSVDDMLVELSQMSQGNSASKEELDSIDLAEEFFGDDLFDSEEISLEDGFDLVDER